MSHTHLAYRALLGTAIGDAFGDGFFGDTSQALAYIHQRQIPATTWEFTDDTVMAIAIFKQLERYGGIHQDKLAFAFHHYHKLDPNRGYGAGARRLIRQYQHGNEWRDLAPSLFEGMGSMGNGAAMRVAPIGAFFYDDLPTAVTQAIKSAEVTHANEEAICGAIAVAVATALATKMRLENNMLTPIEFMDNVADFLPKSTAVTAKILKAKTIPFNYHIETIRAILGDGTKILAEDTIPFCIWCAAHHLTHFAEALWKAISILGDRDTICAIVGGIVISSANDATVPNEWKNNVESMEHSVFFGLNTKKLFLI